MLDLTYMVHFNLSMKIIFKKEKSEKITTTVPVSTSHEMAMKISKLKESKKVDVNKMTRQFWNELIACAEKEDKTG